MNKCTIWGWAFRNKAFTLVELLAVIVILAIIALIATPIVLNIINDSKEESIIRSAELYEKAVQNAIIKKQLDGKTQVPNGAYTVMDDGSICEGEYTTYKSCPIDKMSLPVEVEGEIPEAGSMLHIRKNNTIEKSTLIYKTNQIEKDENGKRTIKEIKDLPKEYQEVEYIESTGAQYIDTDLIVETREDNYEMLLTLYLTAGTYAGANGYMQYTVSQIGRNAKKEAKIIYDGSTYDEYIYSDSELILKKNWETLGFKNVKIGILALGDRGNTWSQYVQSGRVYDAKIIKEDVLVRDFVPCYRKSDEVVGMYDLVEGKFYTNAGTGTFLKGADIK